MAWADLAGVGTLQGPTLGSDITPEFMERLKRMPNNGNPPAITRDPLTANAMLMRGANFGANPPPQQAPMPQQLPGQQAALGGVNALGYRGPDANTSPQGALERNLANPAGNYGDMVSSLYDKFYKQGTPPSGVEYDPRALHNYAMTNAVKTAAGLQSNQTTGLLGLGHIGTEQARNSLEGQKLAAMQDQFNWNKDPRKLATDAYSQGKLNAGQLQDEITALGDVLPQIRPGQSAPTPQAPAPTSNQALKAVDPELAKWAQRPEAQNASMEDFAGKLYDLSKDPNDFLSKWNALNSYNRNRFGSANVDRFGTREEGSEHAPGLVTNALDTLNAGILGPLGLSKEGLFSGQGRKNLSVAYDTPQSQRWRQMTGHETTADKVRQAIREKAAGLR